MDLARDLGAALIGVTHFTKGTAGREPIERITGSLAFSALARIILVAAIKADDGGGVSSRIFARAKSNIGPDGGGFEYVLHQVELDSHPGLFASRVEWGSALEGAACDLLEEAEQEDEHNGAGRDAKDFLLAMLADGPQRVKEIKAAAEANGHVWKTIGRQKKSSAFSQSRRRGARTPAGSGKWKTDRRWAHSPAQKVVRLPIG